MKYIYKSPYRPLWIGFGSAIGQAYQQTEDRIFEVDRPLTAGQIDKLELINMTEGSEPTASASFDLDAWEREDEL